ncbi:sulfatase [Balneolaceae bacterium YR4-1]|uniref:Sulfatase n=1 Tax=Halalkalibaculum roseum TaxID=2709311 RepID=A0A6M1SWE2_9BACT|nr:sulfatase [Halalkalibaculum roseum]NGP77350.1 sulfatase [Halalkalibaculum roseum]
MNLRKNVILFLALFLLYSCTSQEDNGSTTDRPNIIYIMADDHAAHAISAYGGIYDDLAPTPNIDRLAKEGVKFNNVFATNAICGPSRASILTGKYANLHGYYKNQSGGKFDASQWTFPQEFQNGGYQTALFGKWHLGSEPKGFDNFKYHEGAGQQGFYWDPLYNENGKEIKEQGYATNLSTDFALEWLQEQRNEDQPFMMLLQYKAPHRAWEPDKKYEDLWEDIEMPYPDTFNDDYEGRENTAGDTWMTMHYLNRKDMKMDPPDSLEGQALRDWLWYGNEPGEVVKPNPDMSDEEAKKWKYQRYIKDYLATVKSVDDNVGRVLDYLDKQGLTDNTIVVYTSDQGFYLGDHGFFDKRFIYEESLRMPFLVRYPEKLKAGTENNDIITNIDFAPTLLDFAGISTPDEVQGRSFASNAMGNTPEDWRQSMYYHYYEWPFWHHVQPHYGIRTQRYKLAHFYYSIDEWEFYDLEKDPDELKNLINEPQYQDKIEELKQRLNGLQETYKDDKSLEEYRMITDTDFGNKTE